MRSHTHHPLAGGIPPSWASEWGEDEYGVFVGFTVGAVTQLLRWIPPSEVPVLLGSPNSEPERSNNERQHEVIFDHGFWLADSVCTQDLWQEVMGNNPSHFHDWEEDPDLAGSLPVENVSWDDAQEFLSRLNARVPELAVRLPKEAEWEYACRADTRTAFSFGDHIDSQLVNFHGKYPMPRGTKSACRERTVPVKSLPANPWGLHEMHGNVMEWCQEWRGEYPHDRVMNSEWNGPANGTHRIVRGGSWASDAKDCRCAARRARSPSGPRNRHIGFRLLRGPT